MASITVRRNVPNFEDIPVQSYDMIIEVLDATDMPKEIFVFQKGIMPAREGAERTDGFTSVADPVDLEELPVEVPDPVDMNPYYRSDKVQLRFRSVVDLEETWGYIRQDIQGLVLALNTGVEGGSSEDVTFT